MVRQKTDLKIHEEISVLQKKLSETDIQLTEEKKTQVRLKNEANAKVKELNAVMKAIEDEESSFSNDTKAMIYDTQMIEKDNKEKLHELNAQKVDLEHYISALDTIEKENEYLRTQIIQLNRDYEETTAAQEEEREKIKQRNFDARMTMEAVLRKEIQTLDTNFKVLAIQSMNDEAMMARNENQGLYAELSRREDLSRSMISEQQGSYEELQRITIEHEVMITAADYYENVIGELSRVVKKQESTERYLKLEKDKLEDTVLTYESILEEKCDQAMKVIELQKNFERLKEKNRKGRLECIKKCQKALKLSINRATEQSSQGSVQLSKDDEMKEKIKEEEREAAKAELLNLSALLSKSKSCTSVSGVESVSSHGASISESPTEDYDAMWQSSRVQFPQLTGTIRNAVLRDKKYSQSYSFEKSKSNKKKLLLPSGVSASMTNHV